MWLPIRIAAGKGGVFANADICTLSDEWLETINYSEEASKPVNVSSISGKP
jgi:hypothetical protein